jgi:hypothetical protein
MMMQLATKSVFEVETISGIMAMADRLVRFINQPQSKNARGMQFEDILGTCTALFPRTALAFKGSPLCEMAQGECRDLKLRLLEEVKEHIAKTNANINGSKVFESVPLPNDPDECLTRLEMMMGEMVERVSEINKMLARVPNARMLIHRMIDNKRHLERFNEDVFTSMSEDGRVTKKARV